MTTGELGEEKFVTTGSSYYVCPNCERTFEKTVIRGSSNGASWEACPFCEMPLRAAYYEVYE